MDELVPLPATGRRYTASRRVRLGDVTPSGRLRLDALARYLQDIAFDDGEDAGVEGSERWILRRLTVDVAALPRFTEMVELTTWCSGVGPRWAERRTSVAGYVEAAAIWVYVDERGRPARLPEPFFEHWGEAAGDRKVTARLAHGDPPDGAVATHGRPWPLRTTDFDVIGHVNNAAYWEAVEDRLVVGPGRWEIEFRDEIGPGGDVRVVVDGTSLWWTTPGGRVHASVRVDGAGS